MQRWRHTRGKSRRSVKIRFCGLLLDVLLGDIVRIGHPGLNTKKLRPSREHWQYTSRVCQDERDTWIFAEGACIQQVYDCSSGLESDLLRSNGVGRPIEDGA